MQFDQHEEWLPIDGWPYEVSSLGRIRKTRSYNGMMAGDILKPQTMKKGYLRVCLHDRARILYVGVHQLVCEAFHGPKPSPKHEVAHGNNNSSNNYFRNVRWATRAENFADKKKHGTEMFGEKNHQAKLTSEKVAEIRRLLRIGHSSQVIGPRLGVTYQCIDIIKKGKSWQQIIPCVFAGSNGFTTPGYVRGL